MATSPPYPKIFEKKSEKGGLRSFFGGIRNFPITVPNAGNGRNSIYKTCSGPDFFDKNPGDSLQQDRRSKPVGSRSRLAVEKIWTSPPPAWILQLTFFGESNPKLSNSHDVSYFSQYTVLVLLCFFILVLGIFPALLLDVMKTATIFFGA